MTCLKHAVKVIPTLIYITSFFFPLLAIVTALNINTPKEMKQTLTETNHRKKKRIRINSPKSEHTNQATKSLSGFRDHLKRPYVNPGAT